MISAEALNNATDEVGAYYDRLGLSDLEKTLAMRLVELTVFQLSQNPLLMLIEPNRRNAFIASTLAMSLKAWQATAEVNGK